MIWTLNNQPPRLADMPEAIAIIYLTHLVRAAGALILAILFLSTYRRYRKSYLRHWMWSWLAMAVYMAAAAAALATVTRFEATHPARLVLLGIAGVSGYLQIGFLLFGVYELVTRRHVKLRTTRQVLPLLGAVGLVPTFFFFTEEQGAHRIFFSVGLYGLVAGVTFLIAAWGLWRARQKTLSFGFSLMSGAFALYGIEQLHYFLTTIPWLFDKPALDYTIYLGFVDFLFLMTMGLGMVTALLEDEREATSLAMYEIEHLAYHDPLTGLPNRPLFFDRLIVAIARSARVKSKLAVFFIDIDQFKEVNDTLGHSAGDTLLKTVAGRLEKFVRNQDTLARFGADEFTIIIHDLEHAEHAARLAQKFLDALKVPYVINDVELFVSSSIGISFYPDDAEDAETLIRTADTAVHRAKEHGRDSYRIYSSEMNTRALERLALESMLSKATSNGELRLHYQPLVDLDSRTVFGVEALLRWQHPDRGLVLPTDFIAVAEVSGLIISIGDWVLVRACEDLRRLQEQFDPNFIMSVNLSARQFHQPELASRIREVMERNQIARGTLQIEITESNAMQDASMTIDTLEQLREVGVKISVDDFGTGYSSLEYLKKFPIDSLKLDQAFVRDVSEDPGDAAIAQAVIAMAHSLGLTVVAEGVETHAQLEFLKGHGCDRIQGYLFSAALPIDELEIFMARTDLPVLA